MREVFGQTPGDHATYTCRDPRTSFRDGSRFRNVLCGQSERWGRLDPDDECVGEDQGWGEAPGVG